MKTIQLLTAIIAVTSFISCGPSAEQIQAEQQRKIDSAKRAGEIAQKKADEVKAQLEAERKNLENNLGRWKQQLEEDNASLAAAQDKMENIKGFVMFRTQDERNQQIHDQQLVIEQLQDEIKKVQDNIDKANNSLNQ